MTLGLLFILVALTGGGEPPPVESAADEITLRDGKVLLGQVVEPTPRGTVSVIVKRDWAEGELPDWFARWKRVEEPTLRRSRSLRLGRLSAWRRARAPFVKADDPILAWIDRELTRLGDRGGANGKESAPPDSASPLMLVKLSRGEVRSMVRRPKSVARKLRQGWLSGFPRVETMPLDQLESALEGRGFAPDGESPASVDQLLPTPAETEAQWISRRAATELSTDPGLKFVRSGPLLLPEPEPGQPLELGGAMSAVADLSRMLEGRTTDPLAEALGKIAARGRVGALVTQLEIRPDLTAVRVDSTLWVRRADRWVPAGSRNSVVRTDQLAPGAGAPLANDPQVKGVFDLVEALGLGQVSDEMKRRSLSVGAATQKALGHVRAMMLEELTPLRLPVHEAPAAAGVAP